MQSSPSRAHAQAQRALVFDFDGVIADTEPLYWRSWAALLAPYGIKLSWEDYCRFGKGVKDVEMLSSLPQLASSPHVQASRAGMLAERKATIRKLFSQSSPIGTPTIEMLKSLTGFQLGMVTSSAKEDVEPLLRDAGIYTCFHAFVFAEDVVRHKPDPECYLLAGAKLGCNDGLVFEDSDPGMRSARAAGFTVIHVDSPQSLPELVKQHLHQQRR